MVALSWPVHAGTLLFEDTFRETMDKEWTWKRENPKNWRLTAVGLEIRIEPGNMWGSDNNASNVLIRPLPVIEHGSLSITCRVENQPLSQYEQVDLVWYYDDSHMVKIGLELVDGQRSIVMGREEMDKTKTIRIAPMESQSVYLQLSVKGKRIRGAYRVSEESEWNIAGECDLPANSGAHASLQCYQGAAEIEHWALIRDFKIIHEPGE
ncbi:MAG: hypothetical protein AMXMBFR84_35770 [Candidatus Hydrogenedentota bacterium]